MCSLLLWDNSVHFVGYGDTSQIFNIEMALSGYHNDRLSGITDYFSIQDYLNVTFIRMLMEHM